MAVSVFLCQSCSREKSSINEGIHDLSAATCAVVYTTDTGDHTHIEWLDKNMKAVDSTNYSFSGASLDGFANAAMYDNRIILAPRGDNQTRDYGNIAVIHTSDGKLDEIAINHVNPTGCSVEGPTVAVISNLNMVNYIDLANINTGEVKTVELDATEPTLMDVILIDDHIYGYAMVDNSDGCCICSVDISSGKCKVIAELPDASTFMAKYGKELLFISDGQLVRYDTSSEKIRRQTLTRKDAFNLQVIGNTAWVAYTDIHDAEYDSLMEAIDLESGNVICSTRHKGAIMQLEGNDNTIFVLGFDKLYQYILTDGSLHLQNSVKCEKDGYCIGGFYYFG